MDLEVKEAVAPVMAALEGTQPEIGTMNPACAALEEWKVSIKMAQVKRAKPQEEKADLRKVKTTAEGD
jgi:hypothetical protein